MAANIKTLKEDNGDITYPQTKAGAVYTDEGSDVQTVLDDCTRYEEVASTGSLAQTIPASIIDWSSIPIKQAIVPFANLSGNINVVLTRYGNLVICHLNVVLSAGCSAYDEQNAGMCPVGYRPKYNAMVVGNMSAGGSKTGCFDFTVYPSGTVEVSAAASSGATRVQGVGVWWTDNAMPS